jgi:hypothetical protein
MMWRLAFASSLLFAVAACDRPNESSEPPPNGKLASQKAPAPIASSSIVMPTTPTRPSQEDLEQFKQALVRKFDPSRSSTRVASPEGGVLHVPNGRVAHAAVLVKDPDGTLRRQCISSSAEASALVEQIRRRNAQ